MAVRANPVFITARRDSGEKRLAQFISGGSVFLGAHFLVLQENPGAFKPLNGIVRLVKGAGIQVRDLEENMSLAGARDRGVQVNIRGFEILTSHPQAEFVIVLSRGMGGCENDCHIPGIVGFNVTEIVLGGGIDPVRRRRAIRVDQLQGYRFQGFRAPVLKGYYLCNRLAHAGSGLHMVRCKPEGRGGFFKMKG